MNRHTAHGDRNAREVYDRIRAEHEREGGIFGRHAAWCWANFYTGRPGAKAALAVVAHYNRTVG